MATATRTKKTAAKKPVEVEPEELELDEDEELEEVDEEETEEAAPKKKSSDDVTFGASDLARHLSEKHGKTVTARELRTLIRKMARDNSGRVNREITAGNRTRYNWSGLNDPEVKAIIKAYESGELEADKQAKLAELKERKAAKKAAGEETTKKKGKATKKKAAPVEVDEDDDDELELDDED